MSPSIRRRTASATRILPSIALSALMAVAAVSPGVAQTAPSARAEAATDAALRARADALIAQMTTEEKAGQLSIVFVFDADVAVQSIERQVGAGTVGNLLFVTDPALANRLQRTALEQSRLKIPVMFGFDVMHGLHTIFPVPIGLAASWDPAMVESVQTVAANEARAVGIHLTFAPNVDIARDPRWGRMVEGVGEDPYLAQVLAAAQVRGFQGDHIGAPGRIIAGPKHFAAYGATIGGRDYEEVNVSDADLWNVYLPPFKAAIDAGAGNIMSAYMPINGVPATGNHWLLTEVLRDTWGFDGFVVSDNEAVNNLRIQGYSESMTDAVADGLNAGVDMEMALARTAFMTRMPQALANGTVSETALNDAVRRVLVAKMKMGLFDNPYVDETAAAAVLADPAHLQLARVAAERSAVLLRNEGGVLPLAKDRLRSLAVIGPLAASSHDALGSWVFKQNNAEAVTILDGIRAAVGDDVTVRHVAGVNMPQRLHRSPFEKVVGDPVETGVADEAAGIRQAVAAARASDVAVLVLGEAAEMTGESASRSTLTLPGRQQELLQAVIATGKPVVLLLMNGRPLDLQGAAPQAILEIWHPGSAAGTAAANLLFGAAGPGGKLPFTWPANVGQLPNHYAQLTSFDPANAGRRYWNEPSAPTYPFGFGLSYSRFGYANVRVDRRELAPGEGLQVSAELTNAGDVAAEEVAQLYLHQRSGTSARPVRELKGFQRIALAPGETRTVSFTVPPEALTYWNAAKRDWVQDESQFDVAVGGDSTVAFSASFRVRRPAP